jgi:hypothetical protein
MKKSILLIALLIPILLSAQNNSSFDRLFSVQLSKSIYTTPDFGVSFGKTYGWIPDIGAELHLEDMVIRIGFKHYSQSNRIRYAEGDVETRTFSLYELTFKKRIADFGRFELSGGLGPSIRHLNELLSVGIGNPGGWYEIHSDRVFKTSFGVLACVNLQFNLSKRLFIQTSLAGYSFIGSYDMARLGLGIGYRFGRR